MLLPNPNIKTARELITELQPGRDIVMYDPKCRTRIIAQCVRVSKQVYYLTGPQFNDFTARLTLPGMPELKEWELPGLFAAGRDDDTKEAELVDVMNLFLRDHGAQREDLVFTCSSVQDALDTLAGLFAAHAKRPKAG